MTGVQTCALPIYGDEEHIDLNVYNGSAEDFDRQFAKVSSKAELSSNTDT